MKLELIVSARYKVFAVCRDRGECPLMDFFDSLDRRFEKQADGMFQWFEWMATKGKPSNTDVCHMIVKEHAIWQISEGRLRAPFFMDESALFIFTHGFMKKDMKTPAKERDRAIREKKRYFADKNKSKILFCFEEGAYYE